MSVFNLYIIWDRSYVNPLYFLNQRWIIKIIIRIIIYQLNTRVNDYVCIYFNKFPQRLFSTVVMQFQMLIDTLDKFMQSNEVLINGLYYCVVITKC